MTKKQLIKYLKTTEFDIQNARAALELLDLVYNAYANSDIVHGINYSPLFCYITYGRSKPFYQIIDKKRIDRVAKKIYLDYLKNPKTLRTKISQHQKLAEQIDEIWKNYQKNIKTAKTILKTHQEIIRVSKKWWHYGVIGEDKGTVIDLEIVPKFSKKHKIDTNKTREIIYILAHPDKQSPVNLARKDFLNICLALSKRETPRQLNRKINSYLKNYFWIKTDFYNAPKITAELTIEEAKKELKKNGKTKILKELKNIENNFKRIHQEKKELLAQLKLSREEIKDINFAKKIIYWIDRRKLDMAKQFHYLLNLLADTAKESNIKYHDIASYLLSETKNLLSSGKKISQKELTRRNKGLFMVFEKNKKIKIFFGADSKKLFNLACHTKKQKEISGVVASSNKIQKIKGTVRIVHNPLRDKFNNQEILVTSMTRIEFVPLMRKAKAIITNEGGLACHAAIISRELNIPCIIGTRIATQTLKNGNRVELDLNSGVIRKIK